MGYSYSAPQWLLVFFLYCVLGWCFESTVVSVKQRHFVNRGFLRGPMLPIYGFGALAVLISTIRVRDSIPLIFLFGMVGATLLEYVTGAVMERLFNVKYWDYSNQRFNLNGYICLSSSVAWGFLTILMNEVLHPAILHVLAVIPKMADGVFVWVVSAGLAVDLCISVRDAINLRNILVGMENVRREVVILRKRADVVIAVLDQEWREYVKNHPAAERMDEISKERNVPLAQIALNWTLKKEFISSCITGSQSRDKIEANCKVFDWELSAEEMQMLDKANEEYSRE